MPRPSPSPSIPALRKPLLDWYDRHQRDLPWRRTRDPYAIFVSEMMLQQTQVKTVIPYYLRFLEALPDWKALAGAKEEKVLKLWEGLGYYRRARHLQAAAQAVLRDHQGRLPDEMGSILELPGVGPYSAGAVLSIAFQKAHPLVDGNVIRVFSRLFLLRGNLKTGEGNKRVWELAGSLLPQERPGDFNQALMELGATLCLPEDPQCLLCPLRSHCRAAQEGLQGDLPEMPKAKGNVSLFMAAFFIERNGKVLARKRSQEEKWLKGLWEFPSSQGTSFDGARRRLEKDLGVRADPAAVRELRHQITHHKVHLRLFRGRLKKGKEPAPGSRWFTPAELLRLPFSSAQARLRQWALSELRKGSKG